MTNLTINNAKKTIEMTKNFSAAASRFGTDEYNSLQEARRDYPTYRVITVARKAPKSDKPSYKGMTYSYMERYITLYDDSEKSIMREYMLMRGQTAEAEEALAESARYQEMKDWFLAKFPAVGNYHAKRGEMIEKAQKEKEAKRAELAQKQKDNRRAALLTKSVA